MGWRVTSQRFGLRAVAAPPPKPEECARLRPRPAAGEKFVPAHFVLDNKVCRFCSIEPVLHQPAARGRGPAAVGDRAARSRGPRSRKPSAVLAPHVLDIPTIIVSRKSTSISDFPSELEPPPAQKQAPLPDLGTPDAGICTVRQMNARSVREGRTEDFRLRKRRKPNPQVRGSQKRR